MLQTEFRFFFVESKLQECELQHISKGNAYKFIYTPHRPADLCTIAETFAHHTPAIDGVLFYHSEVSYLSQVTPLVGWLKVYMLPEVLGIPIHSDYLSQKPETYTNFLEYVQNFDKLERKRHRRTKNKRVDVEMIDLDLSENMDSNFDLTEESVME